MNKKKLFVAIEFAWILMAIFCIIMAIYYHTKVGADKVWLMYGMGIICIGMFGVRRMQRKNNEKRERRR